MSITKLTQDLSNISALSDYPNSNDGLSSTELKETFDKAGNDIKQYINETLTSEVDSGFVEVQENLDTYKQEVVETYATKDDIAELIIGQIPPGTLREEQFQQEVQDKIDSSYEATQGLDDRLEEIEDTLNDNINTGIKPIKKYNQLGKPTITKVDGVYHNDWTIDFLPDEIEENAILNIETPNGATLLDGTHYFTNDGYFISATNIEGNLENCFDGQVTSHCKITDGQVKIKLPQAMDFSKIQTFITGGTSRTIKGSNDDITYNTLLVIAQDDATITEHDFLTHSAYQYYTIDIAGESTLYILNFAEDENFPTEWLLGIDDGMMTLEGTKNYINGFEIVKDISENKTYSIYFNENVYTEKENKIFINDLYSTILGDTQETTIENLEYNEYKIFNSRSGLKDLTFLLNGDWLKKGTQPIIVNDNNIIYVLIEENKLVLSYNDKKYILDSANSVSVINRIELREMSDGNIAIYGFKNNSTTGFIYVFNIRTKESNTLYYGAISSGGFTYFFNDFFYLVKTSDKIARIDKNGTSNEITLHRNIYDYSCTFFEHNSKLHFIYTDYDGKIRILEIIDASISREVISNAYGYMFFGSNQYGMYYEPFYIINNEIHVHAFNSTSYASYGMPSMYKFDLDTFEFIEYYEIPFNDKDQIFTSYERTFQCFANNKIIMCYTYRVNSSTAKLYIITFKYDNTTKKFVADFQESISTYSDYARIYLDNQIRNYFFEHNNKVIIPGSFISSYVNFIIFDTNSNEYYFVKTNINSSSYLYKIGDCVYYHLYLYAFLPFLTTTKINNEEIDNAFFDNKNYLITKKEKYNVTEL